eukprot:CAMPEP_0114225608 /NCGR_PEP_ID=MMETSP0058-20121206/764_1 /TAXON_ID=36894 /ORGANISM="Pyramimonas parkeae, CCMP726" /LENGTH=130 /DNA_ID=CAMNT_0001336227 /DNA_START=402 /DNA_END=791 /DNA_ORIENTATION=+
MDKAHSFVAQRKLQAARPPTDVAARLPVRDAVSRGAQLLLQTPQSLALGVARLQALLARLGGGHELRHQRARRLAVLGAHPVRRREREATLLLAQVVGDAPMHYAVRRRAVPGPGASRQNASADSSVGPA